MRRVSSVHSLATSTTLFSSEPGHLARQDGLEQGLKGGGLAGRAYPDRERVEPVLGGLTASSTLADLFAFLHVQIALFSWCRPLLAGGRSSTAIALESHKGFLLRSDEDVEKLLIFSSSRRSSAAKRRDACACRQQVKKDEAKTQEVPPRHGCRCRRHVNLPRHPPLLRRHLPP